MRQAVRHIESDLNGQGLKIGIVLSQFNGNIGQGLFDACLSALNALGVVSADIELAQVPGALEIPLILQGMASSARYDALIAIGAVIRGDTYHFEIVANESAAGISRVSLASAIPIVNAVLTTDTDDQAEARMFEKGKDAAHVAVMMARLQSAISALQPRSKETSS
jgi:6,7-dimethyl-8-ribityllumazine synthase